MSNSITIRDKISDHDLKITRRIYTAWAVIAIPWYYFMFWATMDEFWYFKLCFLVLGTVNSIQLYDFWTRKEQEEPAKKERVIHQYLNINDYWGVNGVYVLHDESITGLYKIGCGSPITRRILQLSKTKLPFTLNLKLLMVIECGDPQRTEYYIHRQLNMFRKRGEWFNLGECEIAWLEHVQSEQYPI